MMNTGEDSDEYWKEVHSQDRNQEPEKKTNFASASTVEENWEWASLAETSPKMETAEETSPKMETAEEFPTNMGEAEEFSENMGESKSKKMEVVDPKILQPVCKKGRKTLLATFSASLLSLLCICFSPICKPQYAITLVFAIFMYLFSPVSSCLVHSGNVFPVLSHHHAYSVEFVGASHVPSQWILDSGATLHLVGDDSLFIPGTVRSSNIPIKVANGMIVHTRSTGDVFVNSSRNGTALRHRILAHHAPGITYNLVSIPTLDDHGCVSKMGNGVGTVFMGGKPVIHSSKSKLYHVVSPSDAIHSVSVGIGEHSIQRWHERLGHRSEEYIRRAVPGLSKEKLGFCEVCANTRSRRRGYAKSGLPHEKATKKGEHLVTDTCEMPTVGIEGSKYFAIIMCLKTRYTFYFPMVSKTSFFQMFKDLMAHIFNLLSRFPAWLRCDQGTEYTNKEINSFCREKGIEMTFSTTQNPNQNAHAESRISVVCLTCRSMLFQAGLGKRYWPYAARYSVYIYNRIPHPSLPDDLTPIAAWRGEGALDHTDDDLRHVYTFGCTCYARVLDKNRDKLDQNAELCIFLGIDPKIRGFFLQRVKGGAIFTSRDVVFNENVFLRDLQGAKAEDFSKNFGLPSQPHPARRFPLGASAPFPVELGNLQVNDAAIQQHAASQRDRAAAYRQQHPQPPPEGPAVRRSDRSWTPSGANLRNIANEESNVALVQMLSASHGHHERFVDPAHRGEMLNGPHRDEFIQAEHTELDALTRNKTWTMVDIPRNAKQIACRWVYTYKLNRDNEVERFKARLVAKGFLQVQGVNYEETFAAVAQMKSFRIIMAYAATQGWEMLQIDVNNAFLHSTLDYEVYMKFPPGYDGLAGKCLLLKKSIYGLKQAGRDWFSSLRNELLRLGFTQLRSDHCVYVHHEKQVIISTHVDDGAVFAVTRSAALEIIESLRGTFSLKPAEPLSRYLGMEIDRLPNGDYRLHQQPYLLRLLTRFGLEEANPAITPLPPSMHYSKSPTGVPVDCPYRSIIGSLLYAALGTRPDIAYAVNAMAQFSECPSDKHFAAVKRVLRYLSGTRSLGLVFSSRPGAKLFIHLVIYCDADWAGDKDTKLSRSAYSVFANGTPVSWMSKKQTCHALSSCEAEIIAMCEAIKEAMWLRNFLSELKIKYDDPIVLRVDNESAKALSLDPVNHSGSKHIDLKYKFILECVSTGFIKPVYVRTDQNIADIFTKSPTVAVFRQHMQQLVR
jgi:histone deacetylase 1/2